MKLAPFILILVSRMVRSSEQALTVGGKQVARVCHTKKHYKQWIGANCDATSKQTSCNHLLATLGTLFRVDNASLFGASWPVVGKHEEMSSFGRTMHRALLLEWAESEMRSVKACGISTLVCQPS